MNTIKDLEMEVFDAEEALKVAVEELDNGIKNIQSALVKLRLEADNLRMATEEINLCLNGEEEAMALATLKKEEASEVSEGLNVKYLYTKPENEMTEKELDMWQEMKDSNQD